MEREFVLEIKIQTREKAVQVELMPKRLNAKVQVGRN
jgi:hypothetical protein